MATPGILVERVSQLTGVPEPTVTQIDRNLVGVGLRSKSGRGKSAAKVTPLDAARLLVGVIAADRVMYAEQAVRRYSETTLFDDASTGSLANLRTVPELARLAGNHSFVDLLAAMIAASASGTLVAGLARYVHGGTGVLPPMRMPGPDFELHAELPETVGRLRVFGDNACELVYGLSVVRKVTAANINEVIARAEEIQGKYAGDLFQRRWITSRTIYGLADMFSTAKGNDDAE